MIPHIKVTVTSGSYLLWQPYLKGFLFFRFVGLKLDSAKSNFTPENLQVRKASTNINFMSQESGRANLNFQTRDFTSSSRN